MTSCNDLAGTHRALPDALARIDRDTVLSALRAIADVPGPSQLSASLRGPAVEAVVSAWDPRLGELVRSEPIGTGAVTLTHGDEPAVRFIAHLDEISYLLAGHMTADGTWPLTPYCYHLADGPRPARVIRHGAGTADGRDGEVGAADDVVMTGTLTTDDTDGVVFVADDPGFALRSGDRVAPFSAVAATDDGLVTGSLDNAAGVVAVLLAARVLHACDIGFQVVLPDEEEGPAGPASQTISRGATRALADLPAAALTVVTDIHGLPSGRGLVAADGTTWGASMPEFSSSARGSVTPPPIHRWLVDLLTDPNADHADPTGADPTDADPTGADPTDANPTRLDSAPAVRVGVNVGGYVPRSDDVVAMLQSNAVALLGYPGINRHFDHGLPTAHLDDLVHLARALACVGAAVHTATTSTGSAPW